LIGDPASWEAWKAFLASFFGLPLWIPALISSASARLANLA